MISQIETPRKPTRVRATESHGKTGGRPDRSIPARANHVAHPEYLCPAAEKELFGPNTSAVSVPQWRPTPEFDNGQEEIELPRTGPKSLSRQDEVLLFRRYNCARYHLADLMEKQMRRFSRGRLPEILTWSARVHENRAALTQANMALVVAMAKRTRGNFVEFGELVSEGNMALLRAVDKFDFSRGFKFSTYACSAIMKAFSRLATTAGTYSRRFSTNIEPESERGDDAAQRHDDQHQLALEDLRRVMIRNRAGLTDIEQTVLGARFALSGQGRTQTLQNVGRLLQISQERVRQLQKGALAKLRLAMNLAFSPAATSPGTTNGAFMDLTRTIPEGRIQ